MYITGGSWEHILGAFCGQSHSCFYINSYINYSEFAYIWKKWLSFCFYQYLLTFKPTILIVWLANSYQNIDSFARINENVDLVPCLNLFYWKRYSIRFADSHTFKEIAKSFLVVFYLLLVNYIRNYSVFSLNSPDCF